MAALLVLIAVQRLVPPALFARLAVLLSTLVHLERTQLVHAASPG